MTHPFGQARGLIELATSEIGSRNSRAKAPINITLVPALGSDQDTTLSRDVIE